jgi:hypothetical protein
VPSFSVHECGRSSCEHSHKRAVSGDRDLELFNPPFDSNTFFFDLLIASDFWWSDTEI